MRTAVLATLTLAVLLGAFALLTFTGPPPKAARPGGDRPALAPVDDPADAADTGTVLGAGEQGWVETYDKRTGRLAMMFRADRFAPRPDGAVDVARPRARVLTADGYVGIEAESGRVEFPDGPGAADRGLAADVPGGMPERGELRDVRLALYDRLADTEPSLEARLPNLTFDADAVRLATAADTVDGVALAADEIPIAVTGRDFDFHGRGLVVVWNERDRALKLLEVAHGGTIVVKNPDAVLPPAASARGPTDPPAGPLAARLAAADPAAAVAQAVASPAPPVPTGPPYRATFADAVRVSQAGRRIAEGDAAEVDFATAPDAATRPDAARPDGRTDLTPTPASERSEDPDRTGRDAATVDMSTLAPPAGSGPVTVQWSGRLRVVPLPAGVAPPASPDDRTVRLVGTPAVVRRDDTEVSAPRVSYRTVGEVVRIDGGDGDSVGAGDPADPSAVASVPPVAITGPTFDVRATAVEADAGGATILGRSRVTFSPAQSPAAAPAVADASTPADRTVTARWDDRCRIDFRPGTRVPREAELNGSVYVSLPDARLSSDALTLAFADPAASSPPNSSGGEVAGGSLPPLRRVSARGTVRCTIDAAPADAAGGGGGPQVVTADKLVVLTADGADGRPRPASVVALGSVHASADGSDLRAGRLEATLADAAADGATLGAPSTADAGSAALAAGLRLDRAVASDGVRVAFAGPDGESGAATADRMEFFESALSAVTSEAGPTNQSVAAGPAVDGSDPLAGGRLVVLHGSADAPATLTDRRGASLAGPLVRLWPDAGRAGVEGPGTLDAPAGAVSPQGAGAVGGSGDDTDDGEAAGPVRVAWTGRLDVDGPGDRIDVVGGVRATSTAADGSVRTVAADRAAIALADDPSKASAAPARATVGASPAGPRFASLGRKVLRSAELTGDVDLSSVLVGADGSLVRRSVLRGPVAVVDAAGRTFTVPAAGRMLHEDYRPADPADANPAAPADAIGGYRGATAVAWTDRLTYAPSPAAPDAPPNAAPGAGRVTIDGGVRVVRDAPASRLGLTADRVAVDLVDAAASDGGSTVALGSVSADGGVAVETPQVSLDAATVRFDAASSRLFARDGDLVGGTSAAGRAGGRFDEFRYNAATEQIERLTGATGTVR